MFWGLASVGKNPELKELYSRQQGSLDAFNYCLLHKQKAICTLYARQLLRQWLAPETRLPNAELSYALCLHTKCLPAPETVAGTRCEMLAQHRAVVSLCMLLCVREEVRCKCTRLMCPEICLLKKTDVWHAGPGNTHLTVPRLRMHKVMAQRQLCPGDILF